MHPGSPLGFPLVASLIFCHQKRKELGHQYNLGWFILGPLRFIEKPINWLFSLSLLRALDNASAARINREGERGSPCFSPLVDLKMSCSIN